MIRSVSHLGFLVGTLSYSEIEKKNAIDAVISIEEVEEGGESKNEKYKIDLSTEAWKMTESLVCLNIYLFISISISIFNTNSIIHLVYFISFWL